VCASVRTAWGGGGLAGTVLVIPALLLGGLFLGWTNLRPNFGWFCTERGRTSGKFVFLVFSDKDSFVSKGKNVSNGEIIKGPNFFLRGQIFPANWPEKSAKSWQHWLCTVCTVGGGGGTLTKPVLSVNSIHFTPRKCNQVYCSFQGHYRIKPLPVHCTGLSLDVVREEAFVNGYVYLFYFCCAILCVGDTFRTPV
jgi:hypothetical protein